MKILLIMFALIPLLLSAAENQSIKNQKHQEGEYLGSIPSETPEWFKESFLDFAEDVAEAAAENKRVMIYFHQPGCPYCAKLVNENFTDPKTKEYVQQHFDGITINMWGDREVVSIGNKDYTEKEFALALKVQYTPTVLFLNEQGKTVLRLNGYYPPKKFRSALRYAGERLEKKQSFKDYVQSLSSANSSSQSIHDEDFFVNSNNLKQLRLKTNNVTAVYFEKSNCDDCTVMHQKVLKDKTTRDIVKRFNNVQLDINSNEQIVTPTGETKTVTQWAEQLKIAYQPSVVFFDRQGKEVMRIAGFLKTFHFQSVYDYVFEKGYISEPSFQRYIAERGEKIRALGFNTDIWGYSSEYSLQEIEDK